MHKLACFWRFQTIFQALVGRYGGIAGLVERRDAARQSHLSFEQAEQEAWNRFWSGRVPFEQALQGGKLLRSLSGLKTGEIAPREQRRRGIPSRIKRDCSGGACPKG